MEIIMPYHEVPIKTRNYTMDLFKAIFAIFVVFVHFPLDGWIGTIFSTIGICGVIYFFLISGYSSYDKDDKIACQNILKRLKRNAKITLIVIFIYTVITTLMKLIGGEFTEYLDSFKNPWLFPRLLLLGDLSFINGDPLWFMIALLYTYLILYLLHRFKITKYAFFLLPILILFRIWAECYVNTYNTDWHYASFFLASGVPITLLGHYVAYKKDAFLKSPMYLTITLLTISTIFLFITVFVKVFDYDVAQIFKIWSAFELFILTLKSPGKKPIPVMGKIGKDYSLYIYLFHFLIGVIVAGIIYIPILSIGVGILGSIGLYELNKLIRKKLLRK